MGVLIATACLLMSSTSFAQGFYLVFEEQDFFGGFLERTYIHGLEALNVRQEGLLEDEHTARELVPRWTAIELTDAQLSEYVSRIVQLGVIDWKPQYPENRDGLLCDGYSYYLAIEGRGMKLESSGACATPDSFKSFQKITAALFSETQ